MNRWMNDSVSIRTEDHTRMMDTSNTTTTSITSSSSGSGSIQRLSKQVVDRIAAGEVVQRPSAAVKELLENCLDAKSTHILVHIEHGGLSKIMISDNGCGISKDDLGLAATRFCTSKLCTEQDFATLSTFGFRGEALASMSMVSRLSITSRVATSATAFAQEYLNGEPTLSQPKPCARPVGTTVTCQELFYNLPQRKKLREREEYQRILQTVQHYAVQYAGRGVAMVCQHTHKKNSTVVDLNTTNCIPKGGAAVVEKLGKEERNNVTKKVLAHVFDSKLEHRLLYLECSKESDVKDKDAMTFDCTGFLSDPSYESGGGGTLVLFVNDRLVECPPLKRALEQAYVGSTKSKPFLYVSLQVPPTQVDVNVHPTKRQVTLLHLDDICSAIQEAVKSLLSSKQHDHSFSKSSVETAPTVNPYVKRKRREMEKPDNKDQETDNEEDEEEEEDTKPAFRSKRNRASSSSQPVVATQLPKKLPPSKLIRTSKAAPSGAIEPFLVRTQLSQRPPTPLSNSTSPEGNSPSSTPSPSVTPSPPSAARIHEADCPLASSNKATLATTVDMTQPGAFAQALRSCSCPPLASPDVVVVVRQPRQAVIRPSRVVPTECSYKSIAALRKSVNKMTSAELSKNLRDAIFCGVVSEHRSLVQCGMELVLWNHYELAQELFYQLALAKFGGGSPQAKLGSPIDIQIVISQALEVEEQLQHHNDDSEPDDSSALLFSKDNCFLPVSDTNEELARQAATCLLEHAELLLEYFSIRIERVEETSRIVLSGLPVLLEGHAPPPHGLPVFLLRLATEVDWAEEEPCFQSICRELGSYYAQVPMEQIDDTSRHNTIHHYIQHCLFPAISYLLLPPKRFSKDGSICQLTALPVLYKVFERC